MDQFDRFARTNIPRGYAIVKDGPLRGDDLLFVYPGGGFERFDSPGWTSRITDAADAVLALRPARFDGEGYGPGRRYVIRGGS